MRNLAHVADFLAGGDAHRTLSAEAGVALEVIGVQRFFEPGQVERLELPGPADGGRGVPAQARIDHELDPLSQSLACGPDVGDVARLALPHRTPAELDRAETLIGQGPADTLGVAGRVAEQDRRIGTEFLAKPTAEQLINGPADRLADDVPQGDLDAAHRLSGRPLPAEKDGPFVHAMDEAVDLEGILAQDALGQPTANLVGQGCVNDGLGDGRRRVDLAEADDARIGVNLDDQRFLAAVTAFVDVRQPQMDGFHLGNFHGCSSDEYGLQRAKRILQKMWYLGPKHR